MYRPEPFVTTFVLNAGSFSDEVFGSAFHFFVKISDNDILSNEIGMMQFSEESFGWWDADSSHPAGSTHGPSKVVAQPVNEQQPVLHKWTAVTFCLIFRQNFFDEVAQCMKVAYSASIKKNIEIWESSRNDAIKSRVNTDSGLLQNRYYEMQKTEIVMSFPPCDILLGSFITMLCIGAPTPLPGLLSVTLQPDVTSKSQQPFSPTAHDHHHHSNIQPIKFVAHPVQNLPKVSNSLSFIVNCFGAKSTLDILCCVLSESRMLFHSCDLSRLSVICEGFRALAYPLTWTHVYLPVVPVHLLNLVEAPVPFMLGTHTDNLQHINLQYISDIVVIDCDSGAVDKNAVNILSLPDKEDRWLTTSLNQLLLPKYCDDDPHKSVLVNDKTVQAHSESHLSLDRKIQLLVFDVILHLLRYMPDCLFYLKPNCPVFNRPLFMSEYTTDENRATLEILTVTNAFHTLTETVHTQGLAYFSECISQLAALETQIISETEQNENKSSDKPLSTPAGLVGTFSNNAMITPLSLAGSPSLGAKNRSLTRQLSVSTIIYDKIVASTPSASKATSTAALTGPSPTEKAPTPRIGLSRKLSLRTNAIQALVSNNNNSNGTSTANVTDAVDSVDPPSPSPKLPRPSSVKSISKAFSFFGVNTPKAEGGQLSPMRPHKLSLHPDCQLDELIYGLLFPVWIFRGHYDHQRPCISSIHDLIDHRIKQYKAPEHESDIIVFNSNPPPMTRRAAVTPSKHRSHEQRPVLELELPLPISTEDFQSFQLSLDAKSSCSLRDDGEIRSLCDPNTRSPGSDANNAPVIATPALVKFNYEEVLQEQSKCTYWTMLALADKLHEEVHDLRSRFEENPYSLIYQVHVNQKAPLTTTNRRANVVMGKNNQRNIISHSANDATVKKFSALQQSLEVDDAVTEFLHNVVTMYGVSDESIEQSLRKCLKALQVQSNRSGLIAILKHAKKEQGGQQSTSHVYPLNDSAFEAFTMLFNGMLSICSQQEDFINAYGLLEVGGHYFKVLPQVSNGNNNASAGIVDENEDEDIIEFLSEKTCQHPIFQTPSLWRSLMLDRLAPPAVPDQDNNNNPANKTTGLSKKVPFPLIMTEVRSLLYIMLGLGVNSSRAVAFIQNVAADYVLGIDEYYKLQRFATNLWAQNGDNPLDEQKMAQNKSAGYNNASNLSLRNRSRDGLRERRGSATSLADIMSKTGHGDSMFFNSKSRDATAAAASIEDSFYSQVYNDRSLTNILAPSYDFGGPSEKDLHALTMPRSNTGDQPLTLSKQPSHGGKSSKDMESPLTRMKQSKFQSSHSVNVRIDSGILDPDDFEAEAEEVVIVLSNKNSIDSHDGSTGSPTGRGASDDNNSLLLTVKNATVAWQDQLLDRVLGLGSDPTKSEKLRGEQRDKPRPAPLSANNSGQSLRDMPSTPTSSRTGYETTRSGNNDNKLTKYHACEIKASAPARFSSFLSSLS